MKAVSAAIKGYALGILAIVLWGVMFPVGTELMADGEVLRPDRIVETPEALWVVDCKTGTPRPEHRDQVERYCQVLSRMDGRPVQGFLLYASPTACQVLKVV